MKLEASLNLAKCYQDQDTTKIMKRFHKMLDDTKNADYLDRIYYAMAEVSEKDGNRENTITYLRSSVRTSKNNNKQKVLSSLKAATILFSPVRFYPKRTATPRSAAQPSHPQQP